MTTKERLHTLIEGLPDERLRKVERVLEDLARDIDSATAGHAGHTLSATVTPSPAPTAEERRRILQELQAQFGHRLPSLEEYLANKEREKARDDERWAHLAEECA